jgi:hypothetical protein
MYIPRGGLPLHYVENILYQRADGRLKMLENIVYGQNRP